MQVGVIASGGIAQLSDLEQIRTTGAQGAIIGKALYQKKIDLEQAVSMMKQKG